MYEDKKNSFWKWFWNSGMCISSSTYHLFNLTYIPDMVHEYSLVVVLFLLLYKVSNNYVENRCSAALQSNWVNLKMFETRDSIGLFMRKLCVLIRKNVLNADWSFSYGCPHYSCIGPPYGTQLYSWGWLYGSPLRSRGLSLYGTPLYWTTPSHVRWVHATENVTFLYPTEAGFNNLRSILFVQY